MNRPWRIVLLVAALMAPILGTAAAAAPREAPTLSGTVTLSGSQPGYVPVTVSHDMSLGNPFVTKYRDAVTVKGGGGAAGFALVEDGLRGAILLGGRSKAFEPFVKEHGVAISSLNPSPSDGATFAVPAGSYRLYLITGGKPTTVTLRFLGGTGSSRLTPTTSVDSVVQQSGLEVLVPGPAGGVYSAGGAVTLTTPVLQFSLSRLDTDVHTETVKRHCYYFGKPSGPQPYGPACAAPAETDPVVVGGGSIWIISAEGLGQSFYGWNASLTTSRGTDEAVEADLAAGVSYTSGGLVTGGDYAQYWLSLDGKESAAPSAAVSTKGIAEQAPAERPRASERMTEARHLPATGPIAPAALAPALLLSAAATAKARRRSKVNGG